MTWKQRQCYRLYRGNDTDGKVLSRFDENKLIAVQANIFEKSFNLTHKMFYFLRFRLQRLFSILMTSCYEAKNIYYDLMIIHFSFIYTNNINLKIHFCMNSYQINT